MVTSPSPLLSDEKCKLILVESIENVDRISKLPDHVLLMILTRMSTEDAVRTSMLSKRWIDVWKQMSNLVFDMRNNITFGLESMADRSHYISKLITKVINNHNGHLEFCKIHHFSYISKEDMVETWIRTLTQVKQTKCIELVNLHGHHKRTGVLHLSPTIFSHPILTTLFLSRYDLETAHAFTNCSNLTTLRLERICAEVDVFNRIIASCPSLKVLVLQITWYRQIGCLKIHCKNLKLLHLACTYIDRIEVSAALLDIFSINCSFLTKGNFFFVAPKILQLIKNYWEADAKTILHHLMYNITCNPKEKEDIEHEFVVSKDTNYLRRFTSLAVSLDMMNPVEVYKLKQVLIAWGGEMRELRIIFKEEGESSTGGAEEKKWEEEEKLFFNSDFCVDIVWMYNFNGSNKKEFGLASWFVTQGRVMEKMMIKTSSVPAMKKLETEMAVTKLMELGEGNKELSIECF